MFSRFFIDRPIFASVVSLMIVIAGVVSILNLPVEQYPDLTPPSIFVQANYPGASPEVVSETVQAPLEQAINGVEDMIYMNSVASSDGKSSTTVVFKVGADSQKAMVNVNNRVQMIMSTLPEDVRKRGITVQKRSSSILQVVALYSEDARYNSTYIGNYALLNIVDELKRVEGVGDVSLMGGNDYSMRIWLKPDKLAKLGISTSDVTAAIASQNMQRAAGVIGQQPVNVKVDRNYMIVAQGRYSTVEQFENIILRANSDGTSLKLKDVADIELGSQSYDVIARTGNYEAVPMMVSLSPGANALATAERVETKLKELSQAFPKGIKYNITFETSGFVKNSIKEVIKTLCEAFLLVFFVILIFLKNLRATFIPLLAVPVSIIGAFAGMMLFGFSINTLTLFGLVLAIGIVVDDAIVVIENVERIMRTEKLSPRDATIKAMDEVSGAIVAIVLVLCAVFIPVSFMGGLAGTMYKQFAITIAVSVVISGICALTLTPALCAIFLDENSSIAEKMNTNRFFMAFDKAFAWINDKYTFYVKFFMKNAKTAFIFIGAICLATYIMFSYTPTSLVPDEDQGVFLVSTVLDPAASLDRTHKAVKTVSNILAKDPAVDRSMYVVGFNMLNTAVATNGGSLFFLLKDWSERDGSQSAQNLAKKAFGIGASITDGRVIAFCPPPIVGMSMTGGFEGYIQKIGNTDSKALETKLHEFLAEAAKCPELTGVTSMFNASTPQLKMEVDDLKALSMNVPINEIYNTMASTFGAYYINDFSQYGRGFKVLMQARGDYRAYPDQIKEIYVRSTTGSMIPLSSFVKLTPTVGPDSVERFNVFPAAKIIGNPAPGYTSGQAIAVVEKLAKQVLGDEYRFSWAGSSYQEKITGESSSVALILGLLMVFLILAALYERWTLPFAVIFAVPFGMFGAVLSILMRGFSSDIYFQIALITLVGLSAKNAILIVEFAVMLHHEGMSLVDAAIKAANLRFRPIVMTSLAFILGCFPLAVSTGAGHACRNSLGTGVVGGMIGATVFAPLFIPLMYVLITMLSEMFRNRRKKYA
ncbi:MAG: multidrug efflux RND transporter permease subunit [Alphaproteobacteria bacterium]|nr:multidrug efflux RND transporter permease subunit [Alphaproteobacteria bacterium]